MGRSGLHERMLLLHHAGAARGSFDHVRPVLEGLRRGAADTRILRFSTLRPSMAFSRRDQLSPHFAAAAAAVEELGFRAEVRPVGGTFAPLHGGSLVIEEFGRSTSLEPASARFDRHTAIVADVLLELGIDARLGELEGEYCPGQHSINAGGRVKVSGTAQRVSGAAWLVSTVLQVGDATPLRAVTARCAEIMRAEVDLETIGSVNGELAGLAPTPTPGAVARRIAGVYRRRGLLAAGSIAHLA